MSSAGDGEPWYNQFSLWHKPNRQFRQATPFAGFLTILLPLAVIAYTVYYVVTTKDKPQTISTDISSADGQIFALTGACSAPGGCLYRHNYGAGNGADLACATLHQSANQIVSANGAMNFRLCATDDPIDGVYVFFNRTSGCNGNACFGVSYPSTVRNIGSLITVTKQFAAGSYYLTATRFTNSPEGTVPLTYSSQYFPTTINKASLVLTPAPGTYDYFIHLKLAHQYIEVTYSDSFSFTDIPSIIGGFLSLVFSVFGVLAAFDFARHSIKSGSSDGSAAAGQPKDVELGK